MKLQLVDSQPVRKASSVKALEWLQFQVQEGFANNPSNELVAQRSVQLVQISTNVLALVPHRPPFSVRSSVDHHS